MNLVPQSPGFPLGRELADEERLHLVQDFILSERVQVKSLQETVAFLASSPIFLISFSLLICEVGIMFENADNYSNVPEKVSVPNGTALHTEASVDAVPEALPSGHLGHVIL